MEFKDFDRVPDSMLTDVTEQPASPVEPVKDGNLLSDAEVLEAGKHTKISPLGGTPGSPAPNVAEPGKTKVNFGSMFEGKYAVDMMDALLPALLVVLFRKMNIGVRKSELQLTEGEKKTLSPIVQDCLNTLNLDFSNPWVALAVSIGFIYGSKVIEKAGVGWLDKKATEPIKKKIKKHAEENGIQQSVPAADMADKESLQKSQTHAASGNANIPEVQRPPISRGFSESQINAEMKRLRRGRLNAIESLTKKANKSK